MIVQNRILLKKFSKDVKFLPIKNDILKNLIGIYIISNQIDFHTSLLSKNYNHQLIFILFIGGKNKSFFFEQEKKSNNFKIISGFFFFLNEIFSKDFQKKIFLNSYSKFLQKKRCTNHENSIQIIIQSSTKTLEQEILKMLEIERKLGYFEISLNSLNLIQSKIKQKIKEILSSRKYLNKNRIIDSRIIFFIFIIFFFLRFTIKYISYL
jgi:hypothetical protein